MVPVMFDSELVRFEGWSEKTDEVDEEQQRKIVAIKVKTVAPEG